MIERDVYKLACSVIAGYERRREVYLERLEAAKSIKCTVSYGSVGGASGNDSSVEKQLDKVLELEDEFNSRCVHAVEQAKSDLIWKYGDNEADKIYNALLLHTQDNFRYTYTVLNKTMRLYISKRTFYRLKSDFIETVADFLQVS